MSRNALVTITTMLVLSISFSGCIGEFSKDSEEKTDQELENEKLPYTEDGIFTCVEHDNETRCWQTHIPENLDPFTPVPLVVDMH